MSTKILRLPQVMDECGLARSTVYLRVTQKLLTKPVSLGPRCVGWPLNEIEAINAARISGKTDDGIRELVAILMERRSGAYEGDAAVV